jgi:hypothetical protein
LKIVLSLRVDRTEDSVRIGLPDNVRVTAVVASNGDVPRLCLKAGKLVRVDAEGLSRERSNAQQDERENIFFALEPY